MKILKVIIAILIGYTICSTVTVNEIDIGEPFRIFNITDGSNIYFKFEIEDSSYINISFFLPSYVKEEDIIVYYYGFISEPSDENIFEEDQNFTEIELYENLLDETEEKKTFFYLQDIGKNISYAVIKFTPKIGLQYVGILVNLLDLDEISGIYAINYSEYLDIDIPKLVENDNSFIVHSIEEYTGKILMQLIVPKDSKIDFAISGYGFKTDKIDNIDEITNLKYNFNFSFEQKIREDTNDIYEYSFRLNNETYRYFLIFFHLDGNIERLQIYFEKEEEEKEEEEEEKEEDEEEKEEEEEEKDYENYGIYFVDFLNEYEIKEEFLKVEGKGGFLLASKNPHSGDVYIQYKVEKGISKDYIDLTISGVKNNPYEREDDKENQENLNFEFITTLEEESNDILIYHFKTDEELYFIIDVFILKDLNYISVYLTEEEPDIPINDCIFIDLSLKTDYKIDKTEFPDKVIPKDKQFIIRMNNDGKEKEIQIRGNQGENANFTVLIYGFNHEPSEKEMYNSLSLYTKLDIAKKVPTFFYDTSYYYTTISKDKLYISILVVPKTNLNLFSIFVKNNEKDEDEHIIDYEFEYFEKVEIDEEKIKEENKKYPLFLLYPKEEDNNGEYLLNVIVPENTTEYPVFDIILVETKTPNIEEEEYELLSLTLKYKMDSIEPNRDLYAFSFKLDEDYKYYMISIQLEENIDYLSCYFHIPIKYYNITYSTEYQIEKKYLITSFDSYNTFLTNESHIGDNYIKLKVKKGVNNDSFYLGGCGNSEFSEFCNIGLGIKFDNVYPRDEYDILQYYFKSNESSSYFKINLMFYKDVDYLTIKFENLSEYENPQDLYYEFEYFKNYSLNIKPTHNLYQKYILKPKQKENSGEYLLNIKTSHSENPEFKISAIELKNSTSPMEESNEINITLNERQHDTELSIDTYKYSFSLDKDFKYFMILIKPKQENEYFSYIFELPKIEYNNISYSNEIKIDKKNLIASSSYSLASTAENSGDNFIKLKVQKGVEKDSFDLEGYTIKGKLRYLVGDEVPLAIKYDDKYPGDDYDILQYSFKLGENSKDFKINVKLLKSLDYLSIKFDTKSEPKKKSDDSGLSTGIIVLIVILVVLIAALLVYFIIRKMGCLKKSDVTSKDIESVGQIKTQL